MKLLDLFSGAGGAAMGYHRAGFEVVGVDIEPQPNYPFKFIQGSALNEDDLPAIHAFDAIHASPPCQAYSVVTGDHRDRHPDLVANTRIMLEEIGLPYIIENVVGAPLRDPVQLCGSAFGLPIQRHRLFETTFPVMVPPCAHGQMPTRFEVYEHGRWYKSSFAKVYGSGGGKAREYWPEAMGIDWMTDAEMVEAIPPVFTEHVGHFLLNHIRQGVAA